MKLFQPTSQSSDSPVIIWILISFQKQIRMYQQSPPKKSQSENGSQQPEVASPSKTEQQMKRQKMKKGRALKQFLSKPEGDQILVPQKEAEAQPERPSIVDQNCKICGDLKQKRKQCQFCKDTVCLEHIRKKRKYKNTNKFVRICDQCEDKYLFDKYKTSESKAEQAIAMQEMILEAKRDEFAELSAGKQTKLQMLRNKKIELQEQKKQYDNKVKNGENDVANKMKKMDNKLNESRIVEEEVKRLQNSLPRPLDDDYNCLVQQNNKITRELVKYQKLCAEALKSKSVREKELYEAYYNWEKKQTNKAAVSKKKEQCTIY